MKIRINDKEITDKLKKIRESVGGRQRDDFIPSPPTGKVDISLKGDEIKSLFHPTGLLIRNNHPVFVYIKDHKIRFAKGRGYNKIHFRVCRKLKEMKQTGRFTSRYHVTYRTDNKYPIDTEKEERIVRLDPCHYCLSEFDYYYYNRFDWKGQKKIKEEFDAKEAMERLRHYFDAFRRQTKGLRPDTARTGYSPGWKLLSKKFRESKKFICDECGVKTDQRLTDAHHKDGDKGNDDYDNLACLCKICHGKEHPHYPISNEHREEIERAQEEQGKLKKLFS